MIFEVAGLVFGDKVVECASEEGKVAVVVVLDGIGEGGVGKGQQMREVDVECREGIDP